MKKKKTIYGLKKSNLFKGSTVNPPNPWIIMGHRAGAQVFERGEHKLFLVQDFSFPEGRIKESKLVSDRAGRSFDSYSRSQGGHQTSAARHALSAKESPQDHALTTFTEQLAKFIDSALSENKFGELILVAEPRFLGRLKSHLSPNALRRIILEKEKDYAWLKKPELEVRLFGLLPGKYIPAPRMLPSLRGAHRVS